jgi:hypothetical protein
MREREHSDECGPRRHSGRSPPAPLRPVATSRSSDASRSSRIVDVMDDLARNGRIGHLIHQVEGLVRDNRVEVRVLFGALRRSPAPRGFSCPDARRRAVGHFSRQRPSRIDSPRTNAPITHPGIRFVHVAHGRAHARREERASDRLRSAPHDLSRARVRAYMGAVIRPLSPIVPRLRARSPRSAGRGDRQRLGRGGRRSSQ